MENVIEQSHRVLASYTDKSDGKRKRGIFSVSADNRSKAKNKVGVHLSKSNYKIHSLQIVEEIEEGVYQIIDEGKTYRADPEHSFSSKVRNKLKKNLDKEREDRASDKRNVER